MAFEAAVVKLLTESIRVALVRALIVHAPHQRPAIDHAAGVRIGLLPHPLFLAEPAYGFWGFSDLTGSLLGLFSRHAWPPLPNALRLHEYGKGLLLQLTIIRVVFANEY